MNTCFWQVQATDQRLSYDPEEDHFTCSQGKRLPFKTFDKNADRGLLKVYRAAYQDCQQCPLKPTCVPNSQCRHIIRSAYDPHYRRALERQQSRRGKRMKRLRSATIEPALGSLVDYYGLRKINVRGKAGAHKVMLMAAIAFEEVHEVHHQVHSQPGHSPKSGMVIRFSRPFSRLGHAFSQLR